MRQDCSTQYSEVIVPVAHDRVWQAFISVPKICKFCYHSLLSWTQFRFLNPWGVSCVQLFGCPARSPHQLLSLLQLTVRLYWWTSRKRTKITLSILHLVPSTVLSVPQTCSILFSTVYGKLNCFSFEILPLKSL